MVSDIERFVIEPVGKSISGVDFLRNLLDDTLNLLVRIEIVLNVVLRAKGPVLLLLAKNTCLALVTKTSID